MRGSKTVTVISQVDHGKSTLFDTLLNYMNFLSKYSIDSQFLDSRKDERMRGITLKLSFISTDKIDFIDTPGHFDMESLIELSIAISNIVILIVDINDGITIRLRNILQYIGNRPVILCINKIDMVDFEDFIFKVESIERNIDFNIQEIFYTSFKNNYGFNLKIMQKIIEKLGKKCNAKKNIFKFYFQLLENRNNEKLKKIFTVKNDCITELLPIPYFLIYCIEKIPIEHKKNYAYALLNSEMGGTLYTAIKVENYFLPNTFHLKNNKIIENTKKETGIIFSKNIFKKGNIFGDFFLSFRKKPIYKKYFYFTGKREELINKIKKISLTELNMKSSIDQYNRVELATEGPIHTEKILFDLRTDFSILEIKRNFLIKNFIRLKNSNFNLKNFYEYKKKYKNRLFILKIISRNERGLINSTVEYFLSTNNIRKSDIFIDDYENLRNILKNLKLEPILSYFKLSVECNMESMGDLFFLINRFKGNILNEKYENNNIIILFKLIDNQYSSFVDELNKKKILAYINILN